MFIKEKKKLHTPKVIIKKMKIIKSNDVTYHLNRNKKRKFIFCFDFLKIYILILEKRKYEKNQIFFILRLVEIHHT